MARKSLIERNRRRNELVSRYAQLRRELKATIANPRTSAAERAAAQRKLRSLPRDSSPTRLRSRDVVDGRPRGMMSKFGLSRMRFRAMAHRGELPGIRKSSW
jgi:small subunit ribosomal protein S14